MNRRGLTFRPLRNGRSPSAATPEGATARAQAAAFAAAPPAALGPRPAPMAPALPTSFAEPSALARYDDGHLPAEVRRALYQGRLIREFYVYSLRSDRSGGPGNIGSLATRTDLFTVSTDADFEAVQILSDTRSNLDLIIRIGDSSNRSILSARVAFASLAGTGAQPYWLPTPFFVPRSLSVLVEVTETGSGSRAYNLYLAGARLVG